MAKLLPKPTKKVSKPSGYRLQPPLPRKIGVHPVKGNGVTVPIPIPKVTKKPPIQPTPRGGIQFTPPVFGGSGGGAYPTKPVNNPLAEGIIQGAYAGIGASNPILGNIHPEGGVDLNPFTKINELVETVNKPETWFTVVGFIVALLLILISLYGIVTGTQKQILSSALGQNATGLVNAIKPKKKGK